MIPIEGTLADLLSAHRTFIIWGGILAAIMLYMLRRYTRLLYGLIEICAGLFLLWIVKNSMTSGGDFNSNFNDDFDVFHVSIQLTALIGGVFGMIRGIDSLVESLPFAAWLRSFPSARPR